MQRSDSQQSGSSISSFGLGLLSRTASRRDTNPSANTILLHNSMSSSPKRSSLVAINGNSSSNSPTDMTNHAPLSRIHYKTKHIGLHQLPRASIERRSSSEDENSSRRNSNRSERSRSGSSGFISTNFVEILHVSKRPGPDGHEMESDR